MRRLWALTLVLLLAAAVALAFGIRRGQRRRRPVGRIGQATI